MFQLNYYTITKIVPKLRPLPFDDGFLVVLLEEHPLGQQHLCVKVSDFKSFTTCLFLIY